MSKISIPSTFKRMAIHFPNTNPKPGDVDNVLLAKILQRLAGSPQSGDRQNNLLRKILEQLNGFAEPGDTDNVILQKILDFFNAGGGDCPECPDPEDNGALLLTPAFDTINDIDASSDGILSQANLNWFQGASITEASLGYPRVVLNNANFDNFSGTLLEWRLLESVGGDLQAVNSFNLITLSGPKLATVGGSVFFSGSAALTTVLLPVFLPTDGASIAFDGCALNLASVNLILRRCVLAGLTTAVIDVSGGTSVAPAGQGAADKATLIGNGCTVNTN